MVFVIGGGAVLVFSVLSCAVAALQAAKIDAARADGGWSTTMCVAVRESADSSQDNSPTIPNAAF